MLAKALKGEWSALRAGRITRQGKSPLYPLRRGLGTPQSRSGHFGKVKSSCPCREQNESSTVQPVV